MSLTQITQPATGPVTLAEVRDFLQIGFDGEDNLITSLIDAAGRHVEALTDLALIHRTYRVDLDDWPRRAIDTGMYEMPVSPVAVWQVTVDGVSANAQLEIATSNSRTTIRPSSGQWPRASGDGDGIVISFTAGFADAPDGVPNDLRMAVTLIAFQIYRERSGDSVPDTANRVSQLIAPWQKVRL